MRFRLVPKSLTLDDLELLYVRIFTYFASIRRRVLHYDLPGAACRALTFALARLSCCVYTIILHPTAKVSEGTNRNIPARNTLVQLLALYTNPESHNAQRHRQTDRQPDDTIRP